MAKLKTVDGLLALFSTLICLVFISPLSTAASQDDYPSRVIRLITPLAAGSASDIVLRILAAQLSADFKVPVVVQNQPGGGGVIADRTVTNAPADGYTLG
ncbi:MAG: tripartite tricarboxylate transporter substrate-binding protein, partial [Candidatus Binatus sp.]